MDCRTPNERNPVQHARRIPIATQVALFSNPPIVRPSAPIGFGSTAARSGRRPSTAIRRTKGLPAGDAPTLHFQAIQPTLPSCPNPPICSPPTSRASPAGRPLVLWVAVHGWRPGSAGSTAETDRRAWPYNCRVGKQSYLSSYRDAARMLNWIPFVRSPAVH